MIDLNLQNIIEFNENQSNLLLEGNNECTALSSNVKSKSQLKRAIMNDILERYSKKSNSFSKRRLDVTYSNEGELEQKRRKRLPEEEDVLYQSNRYQKVNETILLSVHGATGQNLHRMNHRTKADSAIIAENSILIDRLRNLCHIQAETKLKRHEANLEKRFVFGHTKAIVEREYLIHRKRMKLVKSLHDARVKSIIESVNSYKCELVNELNQRHRQYVIAECQYRTTLKSFFSRGFHYRNKLRDIRTQEKRIVEKECEFYSKQLAYLKHSVHEARNTYDKEHFSFVRSCMNMAKKRKNKARHPITHNKEDSHDTDLRALVSYIRKDITQLERTIDQLKNRVAVSLPSHDSEHDHVDVMKSADENDVNHSSYIIDDYEIYER